MTAPSALQSRLVTRALELRLHRPTLLLDALSLLVAHPTSPVPPPLVDAVCDRALFLPPERALEAMRAVVASKRPQFALFAALCFNAASCWKAQAPAAGPRPAADVGRWRLLGAEVQTGLLFCALHERIHMPLLRAILHAVPHSLHVLPDAVFVPIFIAMRAACPDLVDRPMQLRAKAVLEARRAPTADLVRLTVACRRGVAGLRELWSGIAAGRPFPQDAYAFLTEGLEQPQVHLAPADLPMLDGIYGALLRRPDLLRAAVDAFLHVFAKNTAALTSWKPAVGRSAAKKRSKAPRTFLDDIRSRRLQIDLHGLRAMQLCWYVRYAAKSGFLTVHDVAAVRKIVEARGLRSALEPVTESSRPAFSMHFLLRMVIAVIAAAHTLHGAEGALSGLICAFLECCAVELGYYREKIETGELNPAGHGKCVSLLPHSRQLIREMERSRRQRGESAEGPPARTDVNAWEIADPQHTVLGEMGSVLKAVAKHRARALLTAETTGKLIAVLDGVVPRGFAEVSNLLFVAKRYASLQSDAPLMRLLRLYRYTHSLDANDRKGETLVIRHVLYLREEVSRKIVLSPQSEALTVEKCAIFIECRFRVVATVLRALLPKRIADKSAEANALAGPRAAAIREVFGEFLRLHDLVKRCEEIALRIDGCDTVWFQHMHLKMVHPTYQLLKRLLPRVEFHPKAAKMTNEALAALQPEASPESEFVGRSLWPVFRNLQESAGFSLDEHAHEADPMMEEPADEVDVTEADEPQARKAPQDLPQRVLVDRFCLREAEKLRNGTDVSFQPLLDNLFVARDGLWEMAASVRSSSADNASEYEQCRFHGARMTMLRLCMRLWPDKFWEAFAEVDERVTALSANLLSSVKTSTENSEVKKE